MVIDWGAAALAGLIATTMMLTLMYVGKAVGLPLDLPRIFGELLGGWYVSAIYGLGLLAQFALGILTALLYALLFELLAIPPAWTWGALFGSIHGALMGLAFGLLPATRAGAHRDQVLVAPGPFAVNYGPAAAVGMVVLHIVYGAVVGGLYRPV